MRDAIVVDEHLIVTTDNSGGIGEKEADVVAVPDELTAYYSARVTLLEQWAANAQPIAAIIHNFSGASSWAKYMRGVTALLQEAGLKGLPISGSTETNMALLQSAVAVTMIGHNRGRVKPSNGQWFTYGRPLVGAEVLANPHEVASISRIKTALETALVTRIWPIGSKGLLHEVRRMMGDDDVQVESSLELYQSAGPSTAILVEIPTTRIEEATSFFGETLRKIEF